jgi:membrane-associated phospholipid phosphatase
MDKKALAWIAAVTSLLALISIFTIDRSLALAMHGSSIENAVVVERVREFLDIFTGRGLVGSHASLGQLLLGALFVVVGLVWALLRRGSYAARALMFAGAVQLATIEAGWLLKDLFGRLRPFQIIASDNWNHIWFAGGNSFPSGHNAFFWGLLLPLAYLFPKYWIALLTIPVFIAFARIDENYHFLSDVLAAIALAALITLFAAMVFERWIKPAATTSRKIRSR